MILSDLTKELKRLLESLIDASDRYVLPSIHDKCSDAIRELHSPLKIAFTGITSAGKSTLLNALVKRQVAPTGAETLTYNVNVFRHVSFSPSGREHIVAHCKDNSLIELPIDALTMLVDGRLDEGKELRNKISWVEAFLNYDYLREIDLIDTPGLYSTQESDSDNTIALFNDELRRPDVVVYLFQQIIKESDITAVSSFQRQLSREVRSKLTGLNTVVGMSQCDKLCEGDFSKDFHEIADCNIKRMQSNYADFRKSFSTYFTLSALYAQSAYALKDSDFRILQLLKEHYLEELTDNVYDASDFINDEEIIGQILSTEAERRDFLCRLDIHVVAYMVWWINENPLASMNDLKNELITKSGVEKMSRHIYQTFRKFSIYFKTIKIISSILGDVNKESSKFQEPLQSSGLALIANECRDFEIDLKRRFAFLSVLIDYYHRKTYFSDNEWGEALKAIDFYLSEEDTECDLSSLRCFWKHTEEHYAIICDFEAKESCQIILEILNQLN